MKPHFLTLLLAICPASASQATEVISFADAAVETLCVAKWDTDGDGRLSVSEAAAVTSLGATFRGSKLIAAFTELVYFTSLTAIDDYAFYQSSITTVAFPPSVKSIGEYAFAESQVGPELVVPGSVKRLEAYCFHSCQNLNHVILEEGVESIGFEAITGPVAYLSIPSSITTISSMSINPYVNAYPESSVFIPKGDLTMQVHSLIPIPVNYYAFYYLFAEGHLIVPFGTVDAYKAVGGWSHFGEYLQAGDVNGDGALNVKDVVSLNAYIMGNSPSPFDERLADLNGDGKINVKDVTLMCSWIMQQKQ